MAYDDGGNYAGVIGDTVRLPPIGSLTPDLARSFFRGRVYGQDIRRREDMLTCRRAELYDQGVHWLRRTATAYDSGDTFSGWTATAYDPNDPLYIPTPVFNLGLSARQNESARLSRPDYKVEVTPRSLGASDIACREAARTTERIMEDALRKANWDKIKSRRAVHMPTYGGYWLKSYADYTYSTPTRVPLPTAVQCSSPNCDFSLATPTASASDMRTPAGSALISRAPQTMLPQQGKSGPEVAFQACPQCASMGGDGQLVPHSMTVEDAASQPKDALGRPLYADAPTFQWRLSVPSPYDIFPRDMGIGYDWRTQAEWVECHVETLDWVALRWPQLARQVRPERADMLAYYHPLTSSSYAYGRGNPYLFRDSVRVKEFHKLPWMEWIPDNPADFANTSPDVPGHFAYNKGRSIIMAADVLLFDGPLLIDSINRPGESVPRVLLDYVPWEYRDGCDRQQGLGLWEILFDPQDIVNETVSQRAAHRQRMAVATIATSKNHNLAFTTVPGIPGRVVTYEVDPEAPGLRPELLAGTNTTIDPGVEREEQDASSVIDKLSGAVEVEQGQVPGNVTAAVAIQTLKGYTSERREPRINRMKESDTRAFKHGAELIQALTISPISLRYSTITGDEAWKLYLATDMAGQTDITIRAVPDFEEKARTQQVTSDLLNGGKIDLSRKSRVVAKLLDAPAELFEDEDRQTDTAQLEWLKLREEGITPRVDPTLDDHALHDQQHGLDLMGSEGRTLEEAAQWDNVLLFLGGSFEQIAQMALMQTMTMPQPGVDLQQAIYNLWIMALTALTQNGQFQPSGDPAALQKILNFRAHREAHRLLMQQQQQGSMMGAAIPAAPGGQADASGNVVSPTSPNPESPAMTVVNTGISGAANAAAAG